MSLGEILSIVKTYPKLQELIAVENTPESMIEEILKEIAADYTASTINKLERLFDRSFARLYSGFHIESDIDVRELNRTHNIVLVPNHQSYADFLGIGYTFYKKIKIPIHIAAGKNLNVFPVGNFFRKSGAFFIRRSFKGDRLYKYILEAYLYYLFTKSYPVKFYFEGGRSRTGKLMPPKYGLFQMLLEAHDNISNGKPLVFLPISISHESLPDFKSHRGELLGQKKKQESSSQLFKLYKLWNAKFGKIHLKIGNPIPVPTIEDSKKRVENLAFKCFRSVGAGIMISPTSLLAMVFLDQARGTLTKRKLINRCVDILEYCQIFSIPVTANLQGEAREASIEEALELFIYQNKVKKELYPNLNNEFYFVTAESRDELLYLKNTILHHFLIPLFIGTVWIRLIRGEIHTVEQMQEEFLRQRNILKFEFYLPDTKHMFSQVRKLLAKILSREEFRIHETFSLSKKELYLIGEKVGQYAISFSYIYEAYYLAGLVFQMFPEAQLKEKDFYEKAKSIFDIEIRYGKFIRLPESYSVPLIKNALSFLLQTGVIEQVDDQYKLSEKGKKSDAIENFSAQTVNLLSMQSILS